ncbi:MAG: lytic transglycosylase domain-containing protein [Firmicutes bacterium]|nr:lytic transglycosylase domain-containing protein [Bacillota bacterium]
MNKTNMAKTYLLTILLVCFVILSAAPNASAVEDDLKFEKDRAKVRDFSFTDVKKASENEQQAINYSGKTIMWEGELVKKIDNDAYFEYILKLNNGDECRVLSGRGISFKMGSYVKIKGMILIKDGRFSHVVLDDIKAAYKPVKIAKIEGLGGFSFYDTDKNAFDRILTWILYYNPGVSRRNAEFIANRIVFYSKKHKTDPYLVTALMSIESAFNMSAISPAGAVGLGQLMPGTASMLGVNPYHPEQNIEGSVRYLATQLDTWNGSMALALASYNAGPGAVMKYNGIPPYRETMDYVNVVSSIYYQIRARR